MMGETGERGAWLGVVYPLVDAAVRERATVGGCSVYSKAVSVVAVWIVVAPREMEGSTLR